MSGDLLLSVGALSIPARSPFNVIFNWSPSGSSKIASTSARMASAGPTDGTGGEDCGEVQVVGDEDELVLLGPRQDLDVGGGRRADVDQWRVSNP